MGINLSNDIDSLTNFKRNSAELMGELDGSGRPKVLTVNGRARLVVQSVEGYQQLLDKAESNGESGWSNDRRSVTAEPQAGPAPGGRNEAELPTPDASHAASAKHAAELGPSDTTTAEPDAASIVDAAFIDALIPQKPR